MRLPLFDDPLVCVSRRMLSARSGARRADGAKFGLLKRRSTGAVDLSKVFLVRTQPPLLHRLLRRNFRIRS
jgi:hypothetical protein